MATSAIGRLSAILELDSARFNKGVEQAQKKMQKFGRNMQRTGKDMSRNLSLPIALAGAGILKAAGDFEAGMNKVQALTSASSKQFEQLSKQARVLGRTTQFSAGQATEGMSFLAQAGFEAQEIFQALPHTLNLAAAAQMDLGRSADIVSNVMQGFGLDTQETKRAVDVMTKAFTSSNTDLEQLGQAMKFAGGVARGLGFSLEETTAALGLLGNAGIQAGIAGRGLRTALADIASEKPKIQDFAETFGVTFKNADGTLKSITEIVRQMNEAGVESTDIYSTFSKQAATVFDTLRQQGAPALQEFTTNLENAGGTAQRIAEVQMKGFQGAMRELRSAMEGAAIAIANSGLLEFATRIAKGLAEFGRSLAEVNPQILKWGTIIAAAAAAAGPLLVAVGLMATGFAAISGPVALATAGIVGITSAITALAKSDMGQKVIRDLSMAIGDFVDSFKEDQKNISIFVNDTIDAFVDMKDDVIEAVSSMVESIKEWFKNPLSGIVESTKESVQGVIDWFQWGADEAVNQSIIPDMVRDIGIEMDKLPDLMGGPAETGSGLVVDGFTTMRNSIDTILTDIINGTKSFGESLEGVLKSIANNVVNKWIDNISTSIAEGFFKSDSGSSSSSGGGNIISTAASAIGKKLFGGVTTTTGAGSSAMATGGGISGASVTGGAAGAGLGGGAGISGASVTGGSAGAGLGGGAASGGAAGAGVLALAPAVVLAAKEIGEAIGLFHAGSVDRMLGQFRGFQGQGPLGTRVGVGGGNAFVGGPNQGFAGAFAEEQGKAAFTSEAMGITAIKDTGANELIKLLQQAQDEFETLKKSAANTFDLGEQGSMRVGQAIKDGVIQPVEFANLGLIEMGKEITHAETGAKSLGEVGVSEFRKITQAVDQGNIRMAALRGEVMLNQQELDFLSQIGVTAAQALEDVGRRGSAAMREIEGAANAAAGAVASVGGSDFSPKGDPNAGRGLTQQLRNDAQTRRIHGGR